MDGSAQHMSLARKTYLALQLQPVPLLIEELRVRIPVSMNDQVQRQARIQVRVMMMATYGCTMHDDSDTLSQSPEPQARSPVVFVGSSQHGGNRYNEREVDWGMPSTQTPLLPRAPSSFASHDRILQHIDVRTYPVYSERACAKTEPAR